MLKGKEALQNERLDNQAVEIELLPSSELSSVAIRWQELEQTISNHGLTNSWTWIKTWLNCFGDIVPHSFAFATKGTQLIGAVMITKVTHKIGPFPVPTIHLGTAGEPPEMTTYVQYNRLLVAPENLDAFAAVLMNMLQRLRWSQFCLDGFVPEHANALIRAGIDVGFQFQVDERKSPTFDFQRAADEGHTDIISALGNNTRYSIRRSMRLFNNNLGLCSLEWAETSQHAKDILHELIDLHARRWKRIGEPGAFQADRVRKYHEELIDALLTRGSLCIFRVKQGGKSIGCLFNFLEDQHVMSYKNGFLLFPGDNRLKPGLVTHMLCMEECRRRGLSQYDFLSGDAAYKRQLSNTENVLTWAIAQRGPWIWGIEKIRDLHHAASAGLRLNRGVPGEAARALASVHHSLHDGLQDDPQTSSEPGKPAASQR